jgi:hypothetical protein
VVCSGGCLRRGCRNVAARHSGAQDWGSGRTKGGGEAPFCLGEKGGYAVAVACLSPPPFPYTAVVSTVCALGYPRKKLLAIVGSARAIRFLILGALAIHYGRMILRIAKSDAFQWTMLAFVFICIGGSVFSLMKWFRRGKDKAPGALPQEAKVGYE